MGIWVTLKTQNKTRQNYYFFEQTGAHHYAAGVFPGNFASYIAAGNRQLPFRKKNLVDSTSTYFWDFACTIVKIIYPKIWKKGKNFSFSRSIWAFFHNSKVVGLKLNFNFEYFYVEKLCPPPKCRYNSYDYRVTSWSHFVFKLFFIFLAAIHLFSNKTLFFNNKNYIQFQFDIDLI